MTGRSRLLVLALLAGCGGDPVAPAEPRAYRLERVGAAPLPYAVPDSVAGRPGTTLLGGSLWLDGEGRGVAHSYLRGRADGLPLRDTTYDARVTLAYTRRADTLDLTFGGCPDGTLCQALAFSTRGVIRGDSIVFERGIHPYVVARHVYRLTLPD